MSRQVPGVTYDSKGRPSRGAEAFFRSQARRLPVRVAPLVDCEKRVRQFARSGSPLGDPFDLVKAAGGLTNVTDVASLQREIARLSAEGDHWKAEAQALAKRAGGLLGLSNVAELVEWITIETEYTPLIRLTDPFKRAPPTNQPSIPRRAGELLKPQITIKFRELNPVVVRPFAAPGPTKWPAVATLGGAVAGGLVGGLFFGFKGLLLAGVVGGGLARARLT